MIVVTRLDDAGPGTLRHCVNATGPRTCVFATGGVIRLTRPLQPTHPYLTVAGQTAPGGGIALTNAPHAVLGALVYVATHDVTWRYTRMRNHYRARCSDASTSECGGLLQAVTGARRVILDHNSLTWNQDEAYGVWRGGRGPAHDITMSMNLIAEGLASHSTGLLVGGETSALSSRVSDIDFHHNLVMNNSHRNPLFKGRSGRLVDNVFYNQSFYVTQVGGGGRVDIVANAFVAGPMTGDFHEIEAFRAHDTDAYNGTPSLYLRGNLGWHQAHPTDSQAPLTRAVDGENGSETTALPRSWRRHDPLPDNSRHPIDEEAVATIADPAGALVGSVGASERLDCTGALVAARDSVDRRLVRQYSTDTGIRSLITRESEVGGLPALAHGTPCADVDRDGMADEWESRHGLSPSDPADGNARRPAAGGYTNLELFLSGLFPGDVPLP